MSAAEQLDGEPPKAPPPRDALMEVESVLESGLAEQQGKRRAPLRPLLALAPVPEIVALVEAVVRVTVTE